MIGTTGRTAWIDAARGLGITLVVLGHAERGMVAAGIAHGTTWTWMDYGIYTFHMPLFFVLAGLNVPASLAKGQLRFLEAKLWTVAYPYVLWSLIQGSILVALSSYTNGQAQVSDLLSVGWRPTAQFWFLYVLMACQLAGMALEPRPRMLAAAALVSFATSTALVRGGLTEQMLHALPFFAAGVLISKCRLSWGSGLLRGSAAVIGFAVVIPLSGRLDGLNFDAALALPASICGIVLLVSLARSLTGMALRAACLLGRASMTIYVMHILAAAGTRIALTRLHIESDPWLCLIGCTAAGIAAPLAAHAVLARWRLLTPLGLAPLRSARQLSRLPA